MPRTSGVPALGVEQSTTQRAAPPSRVERFAPVLRVTGDPRAERTRQTIFDAVATILASRPERVSVGDIVRVAGISRSSFYAHFSSLDDLTAAYLRMQFAGLAASGASVRPVGEPLGSTERAREAYRRLVAQLLEDAPLYSSVLELPVARSAFDDLVGEHADHLIGALLERTEVPVGIPAGLVSAYVAGGTLSLVDGWRRGRIDVSDDELVEALVALLPAWLLEQRPTGASPPAPAPTPEPSGS
ncbi:TetR/AcrR family transcriptional regulator [Plantibacter sp. VKM Ac-2880]|uniref:TetR/AcrR family transcriptional regulator n=1 Tax=Plantibacter sp. VKM Ac-2880 TaxID=2783827 RepID=UPI00188FC8C2|nr:TetR/AcrR family transcriptional regulator [Plantibacter sp. VKM Ac-2880]MBF4569447.1 TetR/AcrR family transcriptional regulator [Plantibacter sp. VKM Ac-2880]